MTLTLTPLALLGTLGAALGAALLAGGLATIPAEPAPRGGRRALERRKALAASALYRVLEPALRVLGGWLRAGARTLAPLPSLARAFVTLERRQRRLLVSAGEPAGLDPWATWALSLLLGGLGLALGALATQGGGGAVLEVVLPLVGLAAPNLRLQALREVRFTAASRDFPVAIELAALAMSAGLDFPGAMRQVTERQRGVAAEELEQVLLALDLGITRAAALRALEERLPVAEVRDLTRAVVLAERKGASVGDALRQVAATSRQRRSVRAEEAAARAGALLLIPLMLLLIAILMLLLGPLLIGGVGL